MSEPNTQNVACGDVVCTGPNSFAVVWDVNGTLVQLFTLLFHPMPHHRADVPVCQDTSASLIFLDAVVRCNRCFGRHVSKIHPIGERFSLDFMKLCKREQEREFARLRYEYENDGQRRVTYSWFMRQMSE